jgi:hypothetical protein
MNKNKKLEEIALNDTLLVGLKFSTLINSYFTNEEAMLYYALISYFNDVDEIDCNDGRDILVQSLLDRAYCKDIKILKENRTNVDNMISKLKNNLYNAVTGDKVTLFDELEVVWNRPLKESYLKVRVNEEAAREYLHYEDSQYIKVRLAPLRDLKSVTYKRAFILFSQWTDYTGSEKFFFVNNANFIESIYGDKKLSGLTYKKYKTHYLDKMIQALGLCFPNVEFRLDNKDNILYKNVMKFKVRARDKEFFDKYALYKRLELMKNRDLESLEGAYNFEEELKEFKFYNMTPEEIIAESAVTFQQTSEEPFAEISEEDFYNTEEVEYGTESAEEAIEELEEFRAKKEIITSNENILKSEELLNKYENDNYVIDTLRKELVDNLALKSELAQYDLDEKFTNVIDNLLEEMESYPNKENYEFSTGVISTNPKLVNDMDFPEEDATTLNIKYGDSRSFTLDEIKAIDGENKYYKLFKAFSLIGLLKETVFNEKELTKQYEYAKESYSTLFDVLAKLHFDLVETLESHDFNLFDTLFEIFTIKLGYEQNEALFKIINIVKNMNYALALYEELKFETESIEDTEVADSNGYGSDLFNMKKEAVSEYPKEEIKSEALKGMLSKEKQKAIANEVSNEIENDYSFLKQPNLDANEILNDDKLELNNYKDNYKDLRYGFEDETIESSRALVPQLENRSLNNLKYFIQNKVVDNYSEWSSSTKETALEVIKRFEDENNFSVLKMFNQFISNSERIDIKNRLDKMWLETEKIYKAEHDRLLNQRAEIATTIPNFYDEILPNAINNEDSYRIMCEWSAYGHLAKKVSNKKKSILFFIETLIATCQENIDKCGQLEGVYNENVIKKIQTIANLKKNLK